MPTIRPARADEYDEIARVWMESWASTGLEDASNFLLAKLRARVPMEIEKGWSLFVADDQGKLAAMLALHLPLRYLDQLFVAPEYQAWLRYMNARKYEVYISMNTLKAITAIAITMTTRIRPVDIAP